MSYVTFVFQKLFGYSKEKATKVFLRPAKVHQHTRESMEKTLENIEKLLASS